MSASPVNKDNLYSLALREVVNEQISDTKNYLSMDSSPLRLLQHFESVREAERQRLSRELHDQIGQDLVALSLELRSLKQKVRDDSQAVLQLEQLQEMVSHLDRRIHDFAWELRPLILDDLGLKIALATLVEKWSLKNGVTASFHCSGVDPLELPVNVESGLYRIIQEALTNISKHAMANTVTVAIQLKSGLLSVVVRDDGRGFDVGIAGKLTSSSRSFGLLGMLERAEMIGGTLKISSEQDSGTTIKVSVPLFPRKKGRYVQTAHLSC